MTHLFFCTWSRQDTEARNIEVNGAMLRNLLDAVGRTGTLQHVALVTGLKHYLGPFEAYGKKPADTPFRESQERLPYENFYYEQEDILFAAAEQDGFTWSVHRPHTLIGFALGNAMNMGVTLAVYGDSGRATGRPFVFPGSPEQYDGATDVTDARLLARQLVWAATDPRAKNEAFNIVNGEIFRWRDMWQVVAAGFGRRAGAVSRASPRRSTEQMVDASAEWRRVVGAARPVAARRRPAGVVVAHRRGPGSDDGDLRRHDEEPRGWFPRHPGHQRLLPRPLRSAARGAGHPEPE